MNGPSAPTPPDPVKTAQAQTQSNRETAITQNQLNSQNQVTPYGRLTYRQIGTWDDGTPRFEATTALSQNQQGLLNQQEKLGSLTNQIGIDQAQRIGEHLGQPISFGGFNPQTTGVSGGPITGNLNLSGVPKLPGSDDFSADRTKVEEALFSRINPQLERDRAALDTRLVNAGIRPGSTAYDNSMDQYNRQVNDARNQAILAGGQEQSRLFGLGLGARQQGFSEQLGAGQFSNQAQQQGFGQGVTNAQLGNEARKQQIAELLTLRNQPINEITALMSGGQVTQPNFITTPRTGIEGTDIAGITQQGFNNQMGLYNQQLAQQNAMMGGLFGLGGAALMGPFGGALGPGMKTASGWALSDRRVKTDIKKVGKLDSGLPIYKYRYKGGGLQQLGVMAQDVEKVQPEAVADIGGVKAVDYAAVTASA